MTILATLRLESSLLRSTSLCSHTELSTDDNGPGSLQFVSNPQSNQKRCRVISDDGELVLLACIEDRHHFIESLRAVDFESKDTACTWDVQNFVHENGRNRRYRFVFHTREELQTFVLFLSGLMTDPAGAARNALFFFEEESRYQNRAKTKPAHIVLKGEDDMDVDEGATPKMSVPTGKKLQDYQFGLSQQY